MGQFYKMKRVDRDGKNRKKLKNEIKLDTEYII